MMFNRESAEELAAEAGHVAVTTAAFGALLGAIFLLIWAFVVLRPAEAAIITCNDRGCSDMVPQAVRSHKARKVHRAAKPTDANGNGVVRSHKTGAIARVSPKFAPKFQAYIDDLEAAGARIRFMGGYRKGPCWSGGLHPCGQALDVCQTRRGVVDPRCNLPGRAAIARIAESHGLFEGGQWCHSDYGHVQTRVTASRCSNLYSAVAKFKRSVQ